jgi:hypothetical protein
MKACIDRQIFAIILSGSNMREGPYLLLMKSPYSLILSCLMQADYNYKGSLFRQVMTPTIPHPITQNTAYLIGVFNI